MAETVSSLLASGAERLSAISGTAALDCQLLMAHVLGQPRQWLYAHGDESIPQEKTAQFISMLDRRASGEPVAYLTGFRDFWNRRFRVTPATLIPRPETELLVEILLTELDELPRRVADLGTGSGAIAISLADERPGWQIIGVDVQEDAISIAAENGRDLDNIRWCVASWCDPFEAGSLDIIVSNPPYIAEQDPHLDALSHEPRQALTAGPDGLACIRGIVHQGYHCLVKGGAILLEHGYDQQPAVIELLKATGFRHIKEFADLGGQPRAVLARR